VRARGAAERREREDGPGLAEAVEDLLRLGRLHVERRRARIVAERADAAARVGRRRLVVGRELRASEEGEEVSFARSSRRREREREGRTQ